MRTRMDADSLRTDGKGLADTRTTVVLPRRAIFAETETSTTGGRTNTKKRRKVLMDGEWRKGYF